jgi:2-keto-4-pentenoate hydratase/2-oxohepta-3-ene-1,7-dioic acid hydratase in catechol pathway
VTLMAVRFALADGSIRIGRLDGDTIRDAGPAGPRGFIPDRDGFGLIERASGSVYEADAVTSLAPVAPTKVIAIGLNYRDHAQESGLDLPEVPVVFAKWPSCLTGHRSPIVIPREETRPDYEGELAVVFSRRCSRVAAADAGLVIGGYCAFNDVSGRRAQLETPLRQFTVGKSFDSFGPMGPCLVDADGVELDQLDVRTTVSGEVMQDSNTRNLIFSVAELVAYVSIATTIEAGDVLITGTPAGVGDSRRPPRYLRAGDVVGVDISGCPTLENPVLAEEERAG